jgi:2-dehydro-3-deoxyphosphogluconate aldolase/(4S)-4-hydroxy-2-oxoglutarate aldolase
LAHAGISSIELTLSTPGTLERVEGLRREHPEGVEIGIGTVTGPDQARAAIEAGADFIVTPMTETAIVKLQQQGFLLIPAD